MTESPKQPKTALPNSAPISVKLLLDGERRWQFLDGDGGSGYLRVHAAQFGDCSSAEQTAKQLLAVNNNVCATRVFQGTRLRAAFGEVPTRPQREQTATLYAPNNGYRYLTSVSRSGVGSFAIKDDSGAWAPFDEEKYEDCCEEASRAGIGSTRMAVHASLNFFHTDGVQCVLEQSRTRPGPTRDIRATFCT